MIQLVQRLHDEASNNVSLFNISGYTTQAAQSKFLNAKDKMDLYIFARNKIGHGYSKYPVTKSGNYNPNLANLIKSFGVGGLSVVFKITGAFLDISEALLNTSSIKLVERNLPGFFSSL